MTIADPEFEIGQLVYHKTPEGDCGIITDIRYSLLDKSFIYEISSNFVTHLAYEHELGSEKTF